MAEAPPVEQKRPLMDLVNRLRSRMGPQQGPQMQGLFGGQLQQWRPGLFLSRGLFNKTPDQLTQPEKGLIALLGLAGVVLGSTFIGMRGSGGSQILALAGAARRFGKVGERFGGNQR